ncbi:MAG: 1,6-anhydro-N-acetylmuramyl-L-alanine amidase AmpD [Rhodoferax sp.]
MTRNSPHDRTEKCQLPWHNGWYSFAHKLASPNFGNRPEATVVDLILLHSISLPPGVYGGDEVQKLFTNRLDWESHPYFAGIAGLTVSAHFYIRRMGELWQFVSIYDRAWHAGESHFNGRTQCNDFSVGIELEGIEGEPFEDAQYETLAALCSALREALPIVHVVGHEHVAPGRKADPGAGFDWRRLQMTLAWPPRCFP